MKRPCFGYFFNKYCCSLVSYRPLPNAKPVSGKKAGKNKLVLSSVSDLQTSNTIYSVGAKAWNSKNERIFLKKQIFFIFCFSFLLFGLKFRATGILCFPNNRKCKSDRMLNFSLMRSAQRKASCCFMADAIFAIRGKFLPQRCQKWFAVILQWEAVQKFWRYGCLFAFDTPWELKLFDEDIAKCQYFCIISLQFVLHWKQLCRFLTDFLYRSLSPLNLQGNPFTIMSLSFLKLTVCARRYSHRRISKRSRLSAARLALDCRAGGRGFDFRGRTNTQGLKITEK